MKTRRFVLRLVGWMLWSAAVGAGVDAGRAAAAPAAAGPVMPDLITSWEADRHAVERAYALPWSPLRFERLATLYADGLKRLEGVAFDALTPTDQADFLLLENLIQRGQEALERSRAEWAAVESLFSFHGLFDELEYARWRREPLDGPAAARRLADLAAQVKQLKEKVEAQHKKGRAVEAADAAAGQGQALSVDVPPCEGELTLTPLLARRGADAVARLREALKAWFSAYDGFQPEMTWWIRVPYKEADKQLEGYAALLREELAGQKGKPDDPLLGEPLGETALNQALRLAWLAYDARELVALAERDLAWGEGQMKAAAAEMGCGDDWKAAMEQVKADFVPPGGQEALVASIGREATEFVRTNRWVTVPPLCEETWRMAMLTPEQVKTIPYAAYNAQQMMVAYAHETMPQEDKLMLMRGNNRAFTRLTTLHELIPGHHLQMYVASRSRTYRRAFYTPFYVEGWALYCELQAWDLGWARTPQERIGMLFWRMNRASRVLVTMKYHLGEMTPEAMVEFLVERVGHERFGALSEVRRYLEAPPLYQVAYLVGGWQLCALREELVGSGKMTGQAFNDAVLAENNMPIECLRAVLTKQPMPRDFRPVWRFADE